MSADDRFKPPTAAVLDVEPEPADPRGAVIVLGVAGLVQLAWVLSHASAWFKLVDAGALRPIGLLFAVGGLGYLYFGIARLVLRADVGGRHFLFAMIGLAACAVSWWSGEWFVLAPLALGAVLAGAGWRVVRLRRRAAAPPESP